MAVSPVFAQKALVKVEYLENYRNWTDANVTNDFCCWPESRNRDISIR